MGERKAMQQLDTQFIGSIKGFDVYFEALEEDIPLSDDLEPDDYEEAIDKISSGEWVYFCAKVSAHKAGIELSNDYLGGCIYASYEQFYTEYKEGYFADMVENAISEAEKTIAELTQEG